MSETVANPANSRPQAAIVAPRTATSSTNTTGEEEQLPAPISALDAGVVAGWVERLTEFRRDVSDAERVDQIRALEQLKAAAAAAEARITVDLDTIATRSAARRRQRRRIAHSKYT